MSTVGEFGKALRMLCKGVALGRRTRNFFTVVDNATLKPLSGLYVKEASRRYGSQGYFWGLNENQRQSLNRMRCPRWVVLFFGPREAGYVATAEQVNRLVASGNLSSQPSIGFPPREYKIHEPEIPREFSECQNFEDIFTTLRLPKE